MASILSAGTSSGTALNLSGDTSGILQLASNNGTVGLTMDTSQNIGIGTTSPSSYGKLAVVGAAANTLSAVVDTTGYALFRATNTSGQSYVGVDSSTGTLTGTAYATTLWGQNAYPTVFATNNAERMRIDSSGNLLVGSTTNPNTAKVRVYKTGNRANIEAEQGDSGGYNFQSVAFNNGGSYYHFNFQQGTNQVGSIVSSGSNTTYNTGSDYRLKDDVAPMVGGLDKVKALKPVTWKWKSTGEDGQGFIAHELAEICPDAVIGKKDAVDEDGKPIYQMVDVSYLVATLTAAIQELNAKVEAQAATITQQSADIAALKAKVGV